MGLEELFASLYQLKFCGTNVRRDFLSLHQLKACGNSVWAFLHQLKACGSSTWRNSLLHSTILSFVVIVFGVSLFHFINSRVVVTVFGHSFISLSLVVTVFGVALFHSINSNLSVTVFGRTLLPSINYSHKPLLPPSVESDSVLCVSYQRY